MKSLDARKKLRGWNRLFHISYIFGEETVIYIKYMFSYVSLYVFFLLLNLLSVYTGKIIKKNWEIRRISFKELIFLEK